ncbi:NADH-quinone oxidoreductase subunit L [Ereboglobus sp. PH5-5]|uniref:proton-conducting transporter transmembrane domain-containing protein n=1 Tax=Ereboglobus sp. PH5-5 TaxID=2940529 RepID=UPI002405E7B9|nr:proton-conducting transporter membrane subunit [Ereboglobus sp. PH5-5]MDF9832873.1 NADH-quinone oxidoreductase subunit L [Ereboglobus sp. PH5-5]
MLSAKYIWLIPLLPLISAAIGTFLPRGGSSRKIASASAILSMAAGFVLSCLALRGALANPAAHDTWNFRWLDFGATTLELGFINDPLTAFMLVMVTFVGSLIFIFSTGYMREDANAAKFFCYLSFFAAAMLGLVVSNSLLLLFVCWELVGLASYLLIGFCFTKPAAAAAAKKAFITTRIGDLGLLIGICWLYNSSGTLLFYTEDGGGFLDATNLITLAYTVLPCGLIATSAVGLLIFCGAVGKSGQFPLHVWLPDAMEGPTPVSALIHAATMVAAGVFLMARVYPLLAYDQATHIFTAIQTESGLINNEVWPNIHALTVVAIIGAITALFGAVVAVAQNDIKRILAFSTVSQLGYMMLAIGVGAWPVAIFHLLTHAFFKALLFLGAGSVIHAAHHEQDIRYLGGLAPRMKITFATFAIGMMALAGVPFLFSGFWSKEGILHAAHGWTVSQLPFYVALVAVVLTAFYMTRLVCEVFLGKARSHASEHAHENSPAMTLPLVLLAVCAIGLGFLGTPAWPWLQSMLEGIPADKIHGHSIFSEPGLMITSIVLVALGIGVGCALYYFLRKRNTTGELDPLEKAAPALWTALANRLYFDELYAATFGRLFDAIAWLSDAFDRHVWGGLINLIGGLGLFAGGVNREFDENTLNGGFDTVSEDLRKTGKAYSRAQTGDAHGYLRTMALGFAGLIAIVILIAST